MSKEHSSSRIIDNKGNAAFSQYCATHNPQISWRPITNDDIGIDGEVELYDDQHKPLAEIIKIQLKSTEKDKSYIKSENPKTNTFIFYAERAHVEYWQKLQNDVLLVVFDNRQNLGTLYAKKIENIDLEKTGSTYIPILFHKEHDLIDSHANDFLTKFSRKYNNQYPKIKPEDTGFEQLYANLLGVDFQSSVLYIAPLNVNRKQVIEDSRTSEYKLKKDASTRDLVKSFLKQKELRASSDWVVHKNNVVTFWDLSNPKSSLSHAVDKTAIEQLSPDEFCAINEDYKLVFKALLRNCLNYTLHRQDKYDWVNAERLFRYKSPAKLLDKLTVQESWKGTVKAKRTVFKANLSKKTNMFYCLHFAYHIDFKEFDNKWYACINPTWTVSVNGEFKSKLAYKEITRIKKLERNPSVYNHFRFISYQLAYKDLYTYQYPYFIFDKASSFTSENIINDDAWLHSEDSDEAEKLSDSEDPNLDSNKNETPLFR